MLKLQLKTEQKMQHFLKEKKHNQIMKINVVFSF